MFNFNPHDWYWRADDGRLYSSKAGKLVSADDSALTTWQEHMDARLGSGFGPTVWPRDEHGEQTDAALADTLEALGVKAPS